jgi:cardiolipin synthase
MGLRLRHLPNVISAIRILLIVPLAWVLGHHRYSATLWVFGVAAASDGIDGFIARRFGWQSELGGMLDPVADKLMLATVFIVLARLGLVPVWLMAVVLARDAVIVTGALSYRMLLGAVKAHPSIISKFNTLCQIAYVLFIIGSEQFSMPSSVAMTLGALVFVTVVVSGIDYVLVYGRMAFEQARARRPAPRASRSKPA